MPKWCLYDAQLSIVVTGTDDWVWTAYCIEDSYFDSVGSSQTPFDFISADNPLLESPIWDPREDFLAVSVVHLSTVAREYEFATQIFQQDIKHR
jgi:hypothetical protein